ncbi:MAG: hypothetical protein HFE45_08650 [Oscillospiraceae bacterium]|nr:hypothetical protein [Oscillospiraceae bacterium]
MHNQQGQDGARQLFQFEKILAESCGFSKTRFHRVGSGRWQGIYCQITEKFADKTRTWKNGLHWANTNGYSPKAMEELQGCFSADPENWFRLLPEMLPESGDGMVYFLLDLGGDWYSGENFWLFEVGVPELVKALDVLNKNHFLGLGWPDYYIASKKFDWIIGYNHHDIASIIGKGVAVPEDPAAFLSKTAQSCQREGFSQLVTEGDFATCGP